MQAPVPVLRLRQEQTVLKDEDGKLTCIPLWLAFDLEDNMICAGPSQDAVIRKARTSWPYSVEKPRF